MTAGKAPPATKPVRSHYYYHRFLTFNRRSIGPTASRGSPFPNNTIPGSRVNSTSKTWQDGVFGPFLPNLPGQARNFINTTADKRDDDQLDPEDRPQQMPRLLQRKLALKIYF